MSYIKAEEVLPPEVLAVVQQYVDGQILYIPRKPDCKKTWGTCTGTKSSLELRNLRMYEQYVGGVSVKALAEEYFLTEKSVQRIIRKYKPSGKINEAKNRLQEVEN